MASLFYFKLHDSHFLQITKLGNYMRLQFLRLYLYELVGETFISMNWLVLVSSQGMDDRGINDRRKHVVPEGLVFYNSLLYRICSY